MDIHFIDIKDVDDAVIELKDPRNYQGYLRVMAHFSNYSWRNIFLIYKQIPHATKLATYETWKNTYGRNVKQGVKAITINAPVEQPPMKRMVDKIDPITGTAVLDENGKRVMEEANIPRPPLFKPLRMMDISQTKGKQDVAVLAGNVMSNESLHQAFVDVLKAMPPTSALQEADSDMAFDIWYAVTQITYERLASDVSVDTNDFEFIVESIAYATCRRFGINVDTAGLAPPDTGIADMLEIICTQVESLIAVIEDRLVSLCKERGIDPMTLHIPPEPTLDVEPNEPLPAELPAEPPTNTEPPAEAVQEETPQNEPSLSIVQDAQEQETEPIEPAATEDTPPPASDTQTDTSTETTQPPLELPEDRASVDVYRYSSADAAKHGAMAIYELSRQIDIECAAYISSGIQYYQDGDSYDFVPAAEIVLEEYGKNRMIWVLAKHMLAKRKHFSKENMAWANAFVNDGTGNGDSEPTFSIDINSSVLNVFVDDFRDVLEQSEKPSFSKRMADARKRSEALNNSGNK